MNYYKIQHRQQVEACLDELQTVMEANVKQGKILKEVETYL